ncbi:hypothetical protein OG21DRAFT_1490826 [Imleria badia]|nr:hypothetical protein OG21DRAFT_1490826 [Imleria badia]
MRQPISCKPSSPQSAQYSLTANNRRRKDLYMFPNADKAFLDAIGYRRKLQAIDAAILADVNFLHKIVANPEIFGHDVGGIAGEDAGVGEDGGGATAIRRTKAIGEHTIYPYIHSFSNIPCKDALLRPMKIPDVLPSDLPPGSDFSLGSRYAARPFSVSILFDYSTAPGAFKEIYGAEDTDEQRTARQSIVYRVDLFLHRYRQEHRQLSSRHPSHPYTEWLLDRSRYVLFRWNTFRALDRVVLPLQHERTFETNFTSNDQSMLRYIYKAAFWKATKDTDAV